MNRVGGRELEYSDKTIQEIANNPFTLSKCGR